MKSLVIMLSINGWVVNDINGYYDINYNNDNYDNDIIISVDININDIILLYYCLYTHLYLGVRVQI